jgi:hypothetical protein
MLWDHSRRLFGYLKRALRMEHHPTVEESYQSLQFSEAIIDYGRMIQAYYGYSAPYAIVEISELSARFRETPRTIKDALLLLRAMGRAERFHPHGWKLQLAGTLPDAQQGFYSATSDTHAGDDDNRD